MSFAKKTLQLAVISALAVLCMAGCGGGGASPGEPPSGRSLPAGHIDHIQLSSAALQRSMNIEVYLPPDYNNSLRYPVLYFLYGYGGNEHSFFGGTMSVHLKADELIAAGRMASIIIVVPNYANGFGVNTTIAQNPNSSGGSIGMYEDYLIREVVPYIDQHYSTSTSREHRYLGGISMGGYAALYLGLTYPGMFGKIGAHSAALWDYGKANPDLFVGQRDWLYATPSLRALRDPMLLAQKNDLSGLRFYLDAGESDLLMPKDAEMANLLHARGAAVEWHSVSGGHDVLYWNRQLENYLSFYGNVNDPIPR